MQRPLARRVCFSTILTLPNDLNAPQTGLRALAEVEAQRARCINFVI
jgi:hypothetical protein